MKPKFENQLKTHGRGAVPNTSDAIPSLFPFNIDPPDPNDDPVTKGDPYTFVMDEEGSDEDAGDENLDPPDPGSDIQTKGDTISVTDDDKPPSKDKPGS